MPSDAVRSLRVDQAFYGESHGGHSLLSASADRAFADSLTSRLDLPDTAPPGVEWSPFVSGFSIGDRYVVASTVLDTDAKRAGMVWSHALIVAIDDLVLIDDLRPLMRMFSNGSDRMNPPSVSLQLGTSVDPYPEGRVAAVAEALTTRGAGPVVCVGVSGFEELIVALWAKLWPSIRRTLSFRMSFGPSDIVESMPPTLVCTPASLAVRWNKYRTVSDLTVDRPPSLASALLRGDPRGCPVREFARDIGAALTSFSEVMLAEHAYELIAGEGQGFESILTALRLAERLSPDPHQGVLGKERLLEKLCLRFPAARSADIASLRNLQLGGFPARDRVWHALSKWLEECPFPAKDDAEFLSVADYSVSETTSEPIWRKSVIAGFVCAARVNASRFATAFWRWAASRPSTAAEIFEWLPKESTLEEQLIGSVPTELLETTCSSLMRLALSRKWLRLHGALASAGYSVGEAVRRQLAVETGSNSLDGLRLALRRSTPLETITFAVELGEPRLIRIAGEVAGKHVSLLESLDYRSSAAQAIWEKALTSNPEAWRGPILPIEAFEVVLTSLLERRPANADLVLRLSDSPLADLSTYSRRDVVWPLVDPIPRQRLLTATAVGWLRQASAAVPFIPDMELQRTILGSTRFTSTLDTFIPASIAAGVAVFEALSAVDEYSVLRWMSRAVSSAPSLGLKDAESIGRLVLARRWTNASDELLRLERTGRKDVRAALRICYSLLSSWTRIFLGLNPISSLEKWELLEEEATLIYSGGPDHDELWSRSGGNNADLQRNGTGRSRWHDALGRLRAGRHPGVRSLLRQMREDFPMNDKLAYLADDPEFGGHSGRQAR